MLKHREKRPIQTAFSVFLFAPDTAHIRGLSAMRVRAGLLAHGSLLRTGLPGIPASGVPLFSSGGPCSPFTAAVPRGFLTRFPLSRMEHERYKLC